MAYQFDKIKEYKLKENECKEFISKFIDKYDKCYKVEAFNRYAFKESNVMIVDYVEEGSDYDSFGNEITILNAVLYNDLFVNQKHTEQYDKWANQKNMITFVDKNNSLYNLPYGHIIFDENNNKTYNGTFHYRPLGGGKVDIVFDTGTYTYKDTVIEYKGGVVASNK
jgi:hypothetical protein